MPSLQNAERKQTKRAAMKLILSILCFCWVSAVAQSPDEIKLKQTVIDFHQSLVKSNTVSINQQSDKALTYGHPSGLVETKNELMKNLETGVVKFTLYKAGDISISMNNNVASVRYEATVNETIKNIPAAQRIKVLEVWIKKGNRWLLFASQASTAG